MTSLNRRQLFALAALGACPALSVRAQISDMGDAINKAGRQRMLSQRMSKAWLAMGQQVEAQRAERILNDSMALFDRQLAELKVFAPTPEIRATYTKLEGVWSDFKGVLVGTKPAQNATGGLLGLDAQVLSLAHQGTQQLELHAGKPVSHLVNVAGRQRMLSQRMAKFHLAIAWKSAGADAHQQIDIARKEFASGLDTLAAAPQTTPAIQQQITLARQQWVFFEAAFERDNNPSKRDAENVFVASENILQVMDQITGAYARLGA